MQGVTPSASSTRQAQVPEVLEGSLVGWKQWLQMSGVSFPRITNTGCSAPTGAPHLGQGMALEQAEIRAGWRGTPPLPILGEIPSPKGLSSPGVPILGGVSQPWALGDRAQGGPGSAGGALALISEGFWSSKALELPPCVLTESSKAQTSS